MIVHRDDEGKLLVTLKLAVAIAVLVLLAANFVASGVAWLASSDNDGRLEDQADQLAGLVHRDKRQTLLASRTSCDSRVQERADDRAYQLAIRDEFIPATRVDVRARFDHVLAARKPPLHCVRDPRTDRYIPEPVEEPSP